MLRERQSSVQKEIGSNFDLKYVEYGDFKETLSMQNYGLAGEDEAYFSKGRDAEKFVLETLLMSNPELKKIALIPPFTCGTVIEPFLDLGFNVHAYSIDNNMHIDIERFRKELVESKASVVLVHRYFGFDTMKNFETIIDEFRENNVVFIEDRTQCLFSSFPALNVDYYVGSFRKWTALPDGGFAVSKIKLNKSKPLNYDALLVAKKLKASNLKYDYLHKGIGEKQMFLDEFREAEEVLEAEKWYYKMSPISQFIQSTLDTDELKKKRRSNYSYLYQLIENMENIKILTPRLEADSVPLYLPVLCSQRKKLQSFLAEHRIYAPVVWPKDEKCPQICNEAQQIYDDILCLPIDQRYDLDDMKRMAKCIEEFEDECFKKFR